MVVEVRPDRVLAAGAPGPRPVIELRGVSKVYETGRLSVVALRAIDLRVDDGEHVAVMGPSGSGKSTLMHIVGCLDVPTAGTYHLAGEDVSTMSEGSLALVRNQRIGFVFQRFNLLPHLDALRNVALPLCYAGVQASERRERAYEALVHVGLADRVDHRPGELSGGQCQRVALARALVTDPDVLLADEPTGNLDSAAAEEVTSLLAELNAAGRTVVLITHEAEVAASAQRVVRLKDGSIIQAPSPAAGAP